MIIKPIILRSTYWLTDYINGSPVGSHYKDIKTIMENKKIGSGIGQQHLIEILQHATQHSPFYREFSGKNLDDFPVVNKSILRENYDEIRVPGNKIPKQKGDVFIQTTSGSTGTPLAIPQNSIKRKRRIAELKYYGKKSGFNSHEKLIHLRTWNRWQNKSSLQSLRENIIPFNITNLSSSKLKELCQVIIRQKPLAIRGYASSIDLLVQYIAANNIKLQSLKTIIAVSESLQDATRELVKEYVGCNIISQYGNEENGILAQEPSTNDSSNTFYLNHASYSFEVLKFNEDKPAGYGELGRIVITDYYNYAFPMIRYDTGDTGIMGIPNEYSNGYPVLTSLFGRRIDLVFDTLGNTIHPMAIARILKHYSEIQQWQFIQCGKNKYILKLILSKRFHTEENIKEELQCLFGKDAIIDIELTNEIPVLASGKKKSVLNKWQKQYAN